MTDPPATRLEGGRRLREGGRTTPPLVSIVNVVFNAAQELFPLFGSIVPQLGEDIEWIVIDGASTDGTVELLRRFEDKIDYWVSEPDRGIYDAMNKGIAAATGEYILHLNAGDRLKRIPRESLSKCRVDGTDIACFSVIVQNWGAYPPRAGLRLRFENSLHHQGAFYKRQGHPGYDTQYRVFSDFDLNQKMLKAGRSIALFNEVVAEQLTIGVSGSGRADEERLRIIRSNFGAPYAAFASLWNRLAGVRTRLKHGWDRLKAVLSGSQQTGTAQR